MHAQLLIATVEQIFRTLEDISLEWPAYYNKIRIDPITSVRKQQTMPHDRRAEFDHKDSLLF